MGFPQKSVEGFGTLALLSVERTTLAAPGALGQTVQVDCVAAQKLLGPR